ncbi:MAG TPA: NlpC/P60 family protein [Caulobacteraceae bacterium]
MFIAPPDPACPVAEAAELAGRAAVCAEARSWLGTPWHHRGRVKGVGVDCAQFPLRVYAACGLVHDFDTGEYPRDWHIHRGEERYLGFVQRIAAEIEPAAAQPGDLLLFRIGRVYSHGAILLAWPQGIHAAVNEGCVTLVDLDRDAGLITADRRCFTLKVWADGR